MEKYGDHAVSNLDLMEFVNLPSGEKADIFYCDPPWGVGMIKFFQTLNNKMNALQTNKETTLTDFIAKLFKIAKDNSKGPIIIENGLRWKDLIRETGERNGLHHLGTADTVYKSGAKFLPMNLHVFHKQKLAPVTQAYIDSLKGTYGMDTIRAATKPYTVPGGIIFDPCCGMGMTARYAVESGMKFRGNEINKAKLQQTIKIIGG